MDAPATSHADGPPSSPAALARRGATDAAPDPVASARLSGSVAGSAATSFGSSRSRSVELPDATAAELARRLRLRLRRTGRNGSALRRSAISAWAVTQTGVCRLTLEYLIEPLRRWSRFR